MPCNQKSSIKNQKYRRFGRRRGLSLIEMLTALAITAMLLTATMVALDVSFKSYAIAAESASTQTATRMVINRLLTTMRTSTAHGPLDYGDASAADIESINQNIVQTKSLEMIDPHGDLIIIRWDEPNRLLTLTKEPESGATAITQPILGGVSACTFQLSRRRSNSGYWVLERGSIDFTVEADDDASLDIEVGEVPPVRVLASTRPRRVF